MPNLRIAGRLLAGLSLMAALAVRAQPYQFDALLDLEPGIPGGCEVDSERGPIAGIDLRIVAEANAERVQSLRMDRCQAGSWQNAHRQVGGEAHWIGAGVDGGDVVRWSVPKVWLPAAEAITIHVLSRDDAHAAADVIAFSEPAAHRLPLGAAFAVPVARPMALGLLVLGICLLARRTRLLAVALLLIGTQPPGEAIAEGGEFRPKRQWQDALNDTRGFSAAIDLRAAEVSLGKSELRFEVTVNNIEGGQVADNARVLFIGNSLTSGNNLPLMLSRLARQAGKTLTTQAVIRGGASLEDHWNAGTAQREIARGGHALVVLQQGPSSLPENQIYLRDWTLQFAPLIRNAGARPALYMVWPDGSRIAFFDAVRQSYGNAALAVNGMFVPAGQVWVEAWSRDGNLPLYGSDDFHPSSLGTYAAALAFFCELYQQSPVGLPPYIEYENGSRTSFPPASARLLQEAAWATHLQHGRRGQ